MRRRLKRTENQVSNLQNRIEDQENIKRQLKKLKDNNKQLSNKLLGLATTPGASHRRISIASSRSRDQSNPPQEIPSTVTVSRVTEDYNKLKIIVFI